MSIVAISDAIFLRGLVLHEKVAVVLFTVFLLYFWFWFGGVDALASLATNALKQAIYRIDINSHVASIITALIMTIVLDLDTNATDAKLERLRTKYSEQFRRSLPIIQQFCDVVITIYQCINSLPLFAKYMILIAVVLPLSRPVVGLVVDIIATNSDFLAFSIALGIAILCGRLYFVRRAKYLAACEELRKVILEVLTTKSEPFPELALKDQLQASINANKPISGLQSEVDLQGFSLDSVWQPTSKILVKRDRLQIIETFEGGVQQRRWRIPSSLFSSATPAPAQIVPSTSSFSWL